MAGQRLLNGPQVARDYETNREQTLTNLMENLRDGSLKPEDFSILELAESILGRDAVNEMRPKSGATRQLVSLMEADSVRYTDFSNITGQILYTSVLDAYESPEFVFTKLIPSKASKIQDMEKIAGISVLGDESEVIGEGDQYPSFGPTQDWIHVARKHKRGGKVEVTKEAVLGDLTGLLLDRCRKVGYTLGLNLEKRVIDALIDENAGAKSAALGGHRYHWRDATYASFQSTTPWANIVTSNGLVDDTDLRAAWQKLMDLRDPYTGEPIIFMPTHLIVTTDNLWTARSILRTVQTRAHSNPSAGTASREMLFPNPVNDNIPDLQVITSQWLDDRAATDTDWWLGTPAKVAERFYIWDLMQEEAPTNHHDMFERDIVYKFKAGLMDVVSVVQPRAIVESQA